MGEKWANKLYYVDLFSGPGRCVIRDTNEEVDGSPLRALKCDFAKYFFFELDEFCAEALQKRVAAFPLEKQRKVKVTPGDCNNEIQNAAIPTAGLGLAFIDPTGISQIFFDTIKLLAVGRKIDLIINFSEAMGIRMNLHQYKESEKNALNRFMGSARWQQRYRQVLTSFDQACREIAQEYLENLRSLGYLAFDSDLIPIKTDRNVLLYYLMFASKNPRGTDFWRKISLIDSHGQRKLGL
jgi:three-Cys-motif partner protein